MGDSKDPRLIWFKGWLFLALGLLSAGLLLCYSPNWRVAVFLVITVWAFCRAYYFAFYVIQHYIDPGYKFSGLGSFAAYFFRKRVRKN